MKPYQFKARGITYSLEFADNLEELYYDDGINDGSVLGFCRRPSKNHTRGEVVVDKDLIPRAKLEILIHELAHAFFWEAEEEVVRDYGKLVEQLIWDLSPEFPWVRTKEIPTKDGYQLF